MAGFGLPNFGQITEAFKKAQRIQQDAQKLQEELDSMELEGKNKDGRVTIWLSGNQLPLRVKVDPSILIEDSFGMLIFFFPIFDIKKPYKLPLHQCYFFEPLYHS